MPGRVTQIDSDQIVADLLRAKNRQARALVEVQVPQPAKDTLTITSNGAPATWQLTAIPYQGTGGSSLNLSLNGVELLEGVDYTVDYTTAIVTFSAGQQALFKATPTPADVLTADYWTTGDLIAASTIADTGSISDTFDRADNASNPNPASDGGTWTSLSWVWGTNTNRLYVSNALTNLWSVGGSASAASGPGGNLNTGGVIGRDLNGSVAQDVTATLFSNGSGNPHGSLYLNFDPTVRSAYWIDLRAGGVWRAPSNANGSASQIGTLTISSSWPTSGTLVRAHHDGAGNISVYVAGSLVGSCTDGTPLTGTWVCLSHDASSASSPPIPSWDSFTATAA